MLTGKKIIIAASLLLIISGCQGRRNKGATLVRDSTTESATGVDNNSAGKNVRDIYHSLPSLELPLGSGSGAGSPEGFKGLRTVPGPEFHLLTGGGEVGSTSEPQFKMARLPEHDDKRFIIAGSFEGGEWTMELYSFSPDMEPIDRLRIYSSESVTEGNGVIRQGFTISDDHRIVVSKTIGGTLIERLTYLPSTEGVFGELRDGKTTTVAFDSYDGVNYIVETFIWDLNSSGGLVKKDLHTTHYRLGKDGVLTTVP